MQTEDHEPERQFTRAETESMLRELVELYYDGTFTAVNIEFESGTYDSKDSNELD